MSKYKLFVDKMSKWQLVRVPYERRDKRKEAGSPESSNFEEEVMKLVWAGVSVNSRSTPRLSASAGCRPGTLKVSTVTYAVLFFI